MLTNDGLLRGQLSADAPQTPPTVSFREMGNAGTVDVDVGDGSWPPELKMLRDVACVKKESFNGTFRGSSTVNTACDAPSLRRNFKTAMELASPTTSCVTSCSRRHRGSEEGPHLERPPMHIHAVHLQNHVPTLHLAAHRRGARRSELVYEQRGIAALAEPDANACTPAVRVEHHRAADRRASPTPFSQPQRRRCPAPTLQVSPASPLHCTQLPPAGTRRTANEAEQHSKGRRLRLFWVRGWTGAV